MQTNFRAYRSVSLTTMRYVRSAIFFVGSMLILQSFNPSILQIDPTWIFPCLVSSVHASAYGRRTYPTSICRHTQREACFLCRWNWPCAMSDVACPESTPNFADAVTSRYRFRVMNMNQIYYVFGFLYVVFFILIATCAEITMVMCYFQLCNEDYRW